MTPEQVARLTPEDIIGVWDSESSFGVMIFRQVGDEIRGAYRNDGGTIVGRIDAGGVLRAWWRQKPSRIPLPDAGEVEWRLLETPDGQRKVLDGRWKYGAEEAFRGGWDLTRIGTVEPGDVAAQFDDPVASCPTPEVASAR